MNDRADVRNAADPEQVNRARRKDRDRVRVFSGNLRAVMQTDYGRAVMWELVERAGVYRSVWSPNSEIHYKAGRQDYGHELLAEIIEADEGLYMTMEREARERARREARGTDAAHTAPASRGGE
jgi:hypothetical protein